MKVVTYLLYFLGIMGAINTLIRFAENTQKYGPLIARRLVPAYPFVVRYTFNPITIGLLIFIGLPILLASFAGDPTPMIMDASGAGIFPLDALGISF